MAEGMCERRLKNPVPNPEHTRVCTVMCVCRHLVYTLACLSLLCEPPKTVLPSQGKHLPQLALVVLTRQHWSF